MFPIHSLHLRILLEHLKVLLQAIHTSRRFFTFVVCIILILLQLVHLLVHLNEQVFHSLHVGLLNVKFDLEGLTALVYSLILRLLQSINLAQLSLFSLYLLLS